MHIFRLYNENNVIIHEYKNLKCNAGDNLKDDLNHIDLFYVKLNDDYSVIKIELILSILDDVGKTISCKLYNSLSSNFLFIKYIKKNYKIFFKNKNKIFKNNSIFSKII